MEGDLTLGGEQAIQYTDYVLQNFTPETHIILLTMSPHKVNNCFQKKTLELMDSTEGEHQEKTVAII